MDDTASNTLSPERPAAGSTSPTPSDPMAAVRSLTVLKLNNPHNTISNEQIYHLVGTAHISRASCDDVRTVIRAVKPDIVMIELCPERRFMLQSSATLKPTTLNDSIASWRRGESNLFHALYSWYLYQMAGNLEVSPGEEFRVALTEADAVSAKVVLGDRPVGITVARMWGSLGLWDRCRLIVQLLFNGLHMPSKEEMEAMLKELVETDAITAMIEELADSFPTIKHTLVTERDEYMAHVLKRLSGSATKVVAVVGAGHLPGIRKAWTAPSLPIAELMTLPQPRQPSAWRWVLLLGVAAGGVAVTASIVRWRVGR